MFKLVNVFIIKELNILLYYIKLKELEFGNKPFFFKNLTR